MTPTQLILPFDSCVSCKPEKGKWDNQKRYSERLKMAGKCVLCRDKSENGKYLCQKCRMKVGSKKHGPGYKPRNYTCSVCGEFNGGTMAGSYCENCKIATCHCGKKFKRRGPKSISCSPPCRAIAQSRKRGEDTSNWRNGGKLKETRALRHRVEHRRWSRWVRERDSYTCQDCGIYSTEERPIQVHAHHVKEFSKYPELRCDIGNGVTLCIPCHDRRHGRHGKR